MNKIRNERSTITNQEIGFHLKKIFENNWKETFLIDSFSDKEISYESFFSAVINCKTEFEKLQLKKNDYVCLLMNNSKELMALYIAGLIRGLRIVPIDPNKGSEEILEIFKYVDFKIVICNFTDEKLNSINKKIINISSFGEFFKENQEIQEVRIHNQSKNEETLNNVKKELICFEKLNYEDLFLITFTSGSTGVPKGVMHSFSNLYLSAMAFSKPFGFNKKNIFYHNLPMTYMAGILNLFLKPLLSESKIIIGDRFSIESCLKFWEKPIKYHANTFWFIPTIVALLLKLDRSNDGVEYAKKTNIIGCCGTAPLNQATRQTFENKYGIMLYESYGLSETLFVSTNLPLKPGENQDYSGSVGFILEGVNISTEEDGELLIGVPWMFKGYCNVDSKEVMKENKFKSGDLGELANHKLRITGRKKDLIIKGGVNLSPRKIEVFVDQLNIFEEFVIVGLKDDVLGEKICCFFSGSTNNSLLENKKIINSAINKKLGRDYQIDLFVEFKLLPKNINGKIDKLKIIEMYANNQLK